MTSSSTDDTVAPEMDLWRERVKDIETPRDMIIFLHDLRDHSIWDPAFYCFEDRDGIFGAIGIAFAGDQGAEHLREVAVALLVALSWDGEPIDAE